MLVIIWILLVLLLGLTGWLVYRGLQHPVIQPAKPLPLREQLTLQHQVRQSITNKVPRLKGLYYGLLVCGCLGVISLLVSCYLIMTKLPLLIFPIRSVVASMATLVIGVILLLVPALVWPSQAYDELIGRKTDPNQNWQLADTPTFERYRRTQIWSVLALDCFLLVGMISWAYRVSTVPAVTIEYLIMVVVIAIPVVALIALLAQLPYLYQNRFLISNGARFGTVHYQANRALLNQQPDVKTHLIIVQICRIIGYALGLYALWLPYSNILAPSFAVDTSVVYPAAAFALVALLIVLITGGAWLPRFYDYLQLLDTKALKFKVAGSDQFRRYRFHLYYFKIAFSILWLVFWGLIIGYIYYFG
ncbi:hypothetical protein C6Y10_04065 [Lactiplantibacillus pentosus]|uniref:hypothetical protein n=1 Tax=Lactiplantibacillus pentosus TaxID=1589 RepID=UPI000D01C5DC|nr:hypothetical protein [Lactiplantibacillus pentosus]PRO86038.1 hypothetical protein C6Y10_04065 [Lactiplantibacillus pentosus]WFC04755.1 hypothetical protein PGN10_07455 [Lactiplantibacillus pentosus]